MSDINRKLDTISIHAPPRGATGLIRKAIGTFSISIHAPPRGATRVTHLQTVTIIDFNSRPSARGDMPYYNAQQTAMPISIHAPPRGATSAGYSAGSSDVFQFTPLREGRRIGRADVPCGLSISIHAPPRGATPCCFFVGQKWQISIHAPPRGATAKDMQFLQIFCSTLANQHGLTIVPRNLSRLFW